MGLRQYVIETSIVFPFKIMLFHENRLFISKVMAPGGRLRKIRPKTANFENFLISTISQVFPQLHTHIFYYLKVRFSSLNILSGNVYFKLVTLRREYELGKQIFGTFLY